MFKDWNWTPRAYRIKYAIQSALFVIGLFAFFYLINWLENVLP